MNYELVSAFVYNLKKQILFIFTQITTASHKVKPLLNLKTMNSLQNNQLAHQLFRACFYHARINAAR